MMFHDGTTESSQLDENDDDVVSAREERAILNQDIWGGGNANFRILASKQL